MLPKRREKQKYTLEAQLALAFFVQLQERIFSLLSTYNYYLKKKVFTHQSEENKTTSRTKAAKAVDTKNKY